MEKELVGEGIKFERIRRITGYLVGTLDRFNDAKYAEVKDRVIHKEVKEDVHRKHEKRNSTKRI